MPETIVIKCPSCKKAMRVPLDAQGKKVKCKDCGATLRVGAAPQKPAPAAPPAAKPAAPVPAADDDGEGSYNFMGESKESTAVAQPAAEAKAAPKKVAGDDDDDNPYDITSLDETPRCPHCAKELDSEESIVCLHCGYNNRTRTITATKRVYATTFFDWCLWLGPGIGCVLAIAGLIGFDIWFCITMRKEWWDPMDEGVGHSSFSQGIRLWVVVMTVWVMWKAAKFAFRRLILQPRPPEVEKKF